MPDTGRDGTPAAPPQPDPSTDGGADSRMPTRRAPFSDNPKVGVRGQRTQQRIVEAALEVFGEQGFHRCSIDRITTVAGCSRVSFYQYFSGKDDLYRYLSGQVARQLAASTEMMGPITPDEAGWTTIRQWVGRHGDIYERYEPVFDVHSAARTTDEVVATGAARTTERNIARMSSKLTGTDLPPLHVEPVLSVLMQALSRTQHLARLLRRSAPEAHPPERVADALADVVHRALFGLRPEVNVHPPGPPPPSAPDVSVVARDITGRGAGQELTATGERTLEALLSAGQAVLVQRGYDHTRVDDVVEAAGVSHGAFYRYFSNKSELARTVGIRAFRRISGSFEAIPTATDVLGVEDPSDGHDPAAALRAWLRRYESAFSSEAGIVDVWSDASRDDPEFAVASAAAVDWGRRRLVEFLRPRGFGDIETEAVVMMSILTARPLGRAARSVDPLARVIERGLLGLARPED